MYYSSGSLFVYESNAYAEYSIVSDSTLPGVPSDDAIENIYFNKTGANPGVYKYNGTVWELTDIGGTGTTENFTFTNNDGQVVQSISAS